MTDTSNEAESKDLLAVRKFLDENPDIDVVEVLLVDLNGVHRGKWLPRHKLESVFRGELRLALTGVTTDIWGRDVPALCATTGDGDGICVPTLRTLKRLPWLRRPTAQLLLHLTDQGEPWGYDPRVVLAQVQKRFSEMGLTAVVAPELEFMLLSSERDADGVPQLPRTRISGRSALGGQLYGTDLMHEFGEVLHEMREACDEMDLQLETLVKELAPGQYELNQRHLGDALQAADNAQMLKRVIKGVAQSHGFVATFMAKPFSDMDGNGFHTHISVLDDKGRNIFDDGSENGSDALRHAIAGLANTMPDLMLVFAPHRNSYRRFATGSHMPIAPTWGYENRDVALRIPVGDPASRRIEHRVAGADANPYLVVAAILAGVMHGLQNRLEAAEPVTGGTDEQERELAADWLTATDDFENSSFVREYLGAPFQEAMSAIKRFEQDEFNRTITSFEYDTYLISS
jgi:glutamine synthetase